MDDIKRLRAQAKRCSRLARENPDPPARTQLEIFGHDFEHRAEDAERAKSAHDAQSTE
jgi:hypothetical protein